MHTVHIAVRHIELRTDLAAEVDNIERYLGISISDKSGSRELTILRLMVLFAHFGRRL